MQGLFSAATALDAAAKNQDIIAHNIAHAAVPGYRRRTVAFEAFEAEQSGSSKHPSLGTRTTNIISDFTPGDYQSTGNPMDVAIQGDGFFVLDGPNGPVYTRNGSFELSPKGELQSKGGLGVLGSSGKITIPPETSQITVGKDGTISADKNVIGKLQVARFDDPRVLTPTGTTLFEAPEGVTPQSGGGSVLQGYREGSNVQVINELVAMISGMRQYEAATQSMHALSDAMQQQSKSQS